MQTLTFPETVRCKSSIATIYHSTNRGKDAYTVCFYNAEGVRQRRMFRDYETAKETAEAAVAELSEGGADLLTLRGRERYAYELAMEKLRPLGMTLDSLVSQAVEAIGILNGSGLLLEAAKQYVKEHSVLLPVKTVPETVAELVSEKEGAGLSGLHVKDLRLRLGRFADAFRCPIASVTTLEIHQFLLALKVGFRTRRNYRQAVGTLLNFAKARGYLLSDHPGVSKVPKEPKRGRKISVFTPSEMTALLRGAKAELIPALALGAFAGLRSEELKRLQWSHVKLKRNLIDLPSEVTKTQSRRLVPIHDNLKKWLTPFVRVDGPVVPFRNLSNQFLKAARRLGIRWRRNVLRHSFVSYRTAETADIARVSMEAGNSPQVVKRDYLEVVDEDSALEWFAIEPVLPGAVISMPQAESTAIRDDNAGMAVG